MFGNLPIGLALETRSALRRLDSPRRLVQFWQNFQTSLVLLIPNCIRHRMITYTNSDEMSLKPREV
jgi:hypothetical protein